MNLFKLEQKVIFLEVQLSNALNNDKFVGKGSRVARLFEECNNLWREISRRSRYNQVVKPTKIEPLKPLNPYG